MVYYNLYKCGRNDNGDYIFAIRAPGVSEKDINMKTIGDQLHVTGKTELEYYEDYDASIDFKINMRYLFHKIEEIVYHCKDGILYITFVMKEDEGNKVNIRKLK